MGGLQRGRPDETADADSVKCKLVLIRHGHYEIWFDLAISYPLLNRYHDQ